jgi:hypothetical protein
MAHENRAPEYEDSPSGREPSAPPVLNETEARQALPLGHMRYVLGISLALVIVAFAAIYFAYLRGA